MIFIAKWCEHQFYFVLLFIIIEEMNANDIYNQSIRKLKKLRKFKFLWNVKAKQLKKWWCDRRYTQTNWN